MPRHKLAKASNIQYNSLHIHKSNVKLPELDVHCKNRGVQLHPHRGVGKHLLLLGCCVSPYGVKLHPSFTEVLPDTFRVL